MFPKCLFHKYNHSFPLHYTIQRELKSGSSNTAFLELLYNILWEWRYAIQQSRRWTVQNSIDLHKKAEFVFESIEGYSIAGERLFCSRIVRIQLNLHLRCDYTGRLYYWHHDCEFWKYYLFVTNHHQCWSLFCNKFSSLANCRSNSTNSALNFISFRNSIISPFCSVLGCQPQNFSVITQFLKTLHIPFFLCRIHLCV